MFNLHIIDGPAIYAPLAPIIQHVLPYVQSINNNNKQNKYHYIHETEKNKVFLKCSRNTPIDMCTDFSKIGIELLHSKHHYIPHKYNTVPSEILNCTSGISL